MTDDGAAPSSRRGDATAAGLRAREAATARRPIALLTLLRLRAAVAVTRLPQRAAVVVMPGVVT